MMDEMNSLIVLTVTLVDCSVVEALLRFVTSEIPCLGVVAVVPACPLRWDESPLVWVGRGRGLSAVLIVGPNERESFASRLVPRPGTAFLDLHVTNKVIEDRHV